MSSKRADLATQQVQRPGHLLFHPFDAHPHFPGNLGIGEAFDPMKQKYLSRPPIQATDRNIEPRQRVAVGKLPVRIKP
jgi:hypothetical protein